MTGTNESFRATANSNGKSSPSRGFQWFKVPDPVRRVFDNFPLHVYSENGLPQRSPRQRKRHVLHVFTFPNTIRQDQPSCNPACLKWQVYLKFYEVDFETTSSNNHASPTGSLPFILPAAQNLSRPGTPIPASKISRWATSQSGLEDISDTRNEVYSSLVDYRIRNAWLHSLYLEDSNFESVARRLYISSASSSGSVQASLAYQLRAAARDELLKNSTIIDADMLYVEARNAFESLSVLLGDDETFSGSARPNILDASVFAYTHLLLNDELAWKMTRLSDILRSHRNLVLHRERLLEQYFSDSHSQPELVAK